MSRVGQRRCPGAATSTLNKSPIAARRNQGKRSNDRNRSSLRWSTQNPCFDTLVTSTSEVLVPCPSDFLLMLVNQAQCVKQVYRLQAMILRQRDDRIQPDLCLAVRRLHMNVQPILLSREEEKPQVSAAEHGWTHCHRLATSRPTFAPDIWADRRESVLQVLSGGPLNPVSLRSESACRAACRRARAPP
jgi:hypothetical protein